ncbi:MAG TPA: type II secretion system F family protein [Gaiellaceae bacterium]|nr:type II secretion system F family protein [Gaiellaceae bacterium]
MLFVAVLCLAGSVYLVAEYVSLPARERMLSFRRAAAYGKRRQKKESSIQGSLRSRAVVPAMEHAARAVLRLNPKMTVEAVQLRLLSAGVGRRVSPMAFLATKGFAAVGGLLFGLVLIGASRGPAMGIAMGAAFGALGFIAPDFVLSKKIRNRQERISTDLPDALDLLAVSVEAGLGFDAAVAKITEQVEGPLGEEFALTLNEMRIGESRQDALKKLAERTSIPEIGAFSRAIIQADQFGISLGRILRVQAVDTRHRRQIAAEEKAMKAPVKMLFPTVIFIFPSMFIVILGPAFLNLTKVLSL